MRASPYLSFAPLAAGLLLFAAVPFGCAKGFTGLPPDGSGGAGGTGGASGQGGTSGIVTSTTDVGSTMPDTSSGPSATGSGGAGPSTVASGPSTVASGPSTVASGPSTVASGPSTSAVTVGSGPSGPCDGTGVCQTCADCAQNGSCSAEVDACNNDFTFECPFFADCVSQCGNSSACIQSCQQVYPTGAQLYNDLAVCVVCQACYQDCGGAQAGCP